MKTTGINYVMIEVGLVLHQHPLVHATLITLVHISSYTYVDCWFLKYVF